MRTPCNPKASSPDEEGKTWEREWRKDKRKEEERKITTISSLYKYSNYDRTGRVTSERFFSFLFLNKRNRGMMHK